VGILNLIESNDQALTVIALEQTVRGSVRIGIDLGDDPLVVWRPAESLQLLGRRLRRPPDPMYLPPASLGLRHGPASVDPLPVGHLTAPHQARAPGLVADLPAQLGELVTEGIGTIEVLVGAGLQALLEQLLCLGRGRLLLAQQ
jgi:hypothetical protein